MPPKRLVLDANLLLLWVIGAAQPDLLGKEKHVRQFTEDDLLFLQRIVSGFQQIVLTPNIVTECSNLLGDSDRTYPSKQFLKCLLEEAVQEEYVPSQKAAGRPQFQWLGVSDCAALELVDDSTVLLTCDHKLTDAACQVNPLSCNFDYVRFSDIGLPE